MNTTLQVQEVPFHGEGVLMAQEKDGEVWVPVKRLCENLGIDPYTQNIKIQNDPRFNYQDILVVAPDGKNREMLCLPVDQVSGWLFSINANKVKPAARDKLILYQRECVKVLDAYWRGGVQGELFKTQTQLIRALETMIA